MLLLSSKYAFNETVLIYNDWEWDTVRGVASIQKDFGHMPHDPAPSDTRGHSKGKKMNEDDVETHQHA